MELHRRCESNQNASVEDGGSSPPPRMYLLEAGIVKLISFSFACNVEGADWQPWKLSPLFLHRTGIARAAAMQASPHCPANAPQPSTEEVTSGGEWVEESLSMQLLLPVVLAGQAAGRRPPPCLGWTTGLEQMITLCIVKRRGLDSLRLHYSAWLLSHFDVSLWLDGTFAFFFLLVLHCFVLRDLVHALCTHRQSSMWMTECSLIANVIKKSSSWWQPSVRKEL